MRQMVAFGDGVMDVQAIVEAVKATAFDGFISLEQDSFGGDMNEVCRRYLRIMKEHFA
jgi:sugar phosphate isomerase/epimerase